MQIFLRGMGCIGLIVGVIVSFFIIEFFLMMRAHEQARQVVRGSLPDLFPVLVFANQQPHIVWGDKLEAFKTAHPEYSFRVPLENEATIRTQVERNVRGRQSPLNFDWDSDLPWSATFRIEGHREGRQQIRMEATFDDDRMNIGWYEATEKEIYPRHHTLYFGPGHVFATLPLAVVLTAVLWLIVGITWRVKFGRNNSLTTLSIVPRHEADV